MRLTHQLGRGTKVHLLLDDEYQITTSTTFWAEHYLPDGHGDQRGRLAALGAADQRAAKALNKAVELLSHRDHSAKELRDKLLRTADSDAADKAVAQMLDAGYLDDEKYARRLVRHLIEDKKCSAYHARQECQKRGIDREIIDRALAEQAPDNVQTAKDLILRKYSRKLQQEDGRQKVMAALARRGFGYHDIQAALEQLEDEEYL